MAARVKMLFAFGFASAAIGFSELAAADDSRPARAIGDDMHAYYAGERTTAFVFMGLGVASAAAGGVLVTRSGDFARGLGWSMLSLGALEVLGAGFYALQVNGEIDHYSETLARDPSAFKREELTHIHGTTSRFVIYRLTELGLALAGAGVATYGFASGKDTWKGVGIGVAAEALTFFALDSFGQSRAHEYEDHVRRFEPTVSVQVGGGDRPSALLLGSRF